MWDDPRRGRWRCWCSAGRRGAVPAVVCARFHLRTAPMPSGGGRPQMIVYGTEVVPLGTRLGVPLPGPYKVNGVPLRRINQAYVIATKKTVDVSGVKLPETVNDKFFKAAEEGKKGKSEAAFLEGDAIKVCSHLLPCLSLHPCSLPVCLVTPMPQPFDSARYTHTCACAHEVVLSVAPRRCSIRP
jgi:hypothetical protein